MRELIGYKLKTECKKYINAAKAINGSDCDYFRGVAEYLSVQAGAVVSRLKAAGVLELWFEEVYKSEIIPIINGYQGQYIKYDKVIYFNNIPYKIETLCTLFELQLEVRSVSFKDKNSVSLTMNQIEEILNYCHEINNLP